jgi:hypothetical protein
MSDNTLDADCFNLEALLCEPPLEQEATCLELPSFEGVDAI